MHFLPVHISLALECPEARDKQAHQGLRECQEDTGQQRDRHPTTTTGFVVEDAETDGRRSEEDQETAEPTQREELIEIDREAGSPGDGEEDDDENLISDEEREGL